MDYESVYQDTLTRLASAKNKSAIARRLSLSPRWVHDLLNGKYKDPGYFKIHALIDILDEQEVEQC